MSIWNRENIPLKDWGIKLVDPEVFSSQHGVRKIWKLFFSKVTEDYNFSLVEKEVQTLLEDSSIRDVQALRNNIIYRLEIKDETIDVEFMKSVLHKLGTGTGAVTAGLASRFGALSNSRAGLVSDFSAVEKRMLEEEIRKGLEEEEEAFKSAGTDFNHPERSKYSATPRYPKFYNRIRSGVVWNKYAQTHFDEDNPPPKQVLGYKFSIFYPDLVDPSTPPKYKLENCTTSREHILLRFISGAPYEDVVFKIVNKEWDLDRRSGFTCIFERGVLQLHFVFKKDRYRR